MNGPTVAVAQHLDLDVARLREIFLEIKRLIAEGGLGLRASGGERCDEVFRPLRYLHAPPAAPGSSLEENRKTKRMRHRYRLLIGGQAAIGPRHHRHAQSFRRAPGFDLVAHESNMRRLRPDEMNVVLSEYFGKACILREKAVTGMHRVGAGDLAGGQQRRDIEIAVAGRGRANAHALVRSE